MTPPDLTPLPKGQRRVAEALIDGNKARTYNEVAQRLELSLGTVYEHLRRIRLNHPELYAAIMAVRKRQLEPALCFNVSRQRAAESDLSVF